MRPTAPAIIALAGTLALSACTETQDLSEDVDSSDAFVIEAWADNWFALYVGDELAVEDSVPITTERSFNAERVSFDGSYPLVLNFVLKDFKEDDSGLEYIGASNQQMGDGGFIAQIKDNATGDVLAVSDATWKCLAIHQAPLNKSCEGSSSPSTECDSATIAEPEGWKAADYDTSGWSDATVHDAAAVDPKGGYDSITWSSDARLVWTDDLETDNTILCKVIVEAP